MRENKKGTLRGKVTCPKCGKSVERLRISELYKCCFTCSMELLPKSTLKKEIEIQPEIKEKSEDIQEYSKDVAGVIYINMVIADLAVKGYRIYTAVSPAYPYQIVAVNDSGAKRVKVISKSTPITKALKGLNQGKYKHIAVVSTLRQIKYIPEI
jgi:endogenous inhibitor of DNA gyrase (YacG/DUF329 family)